MPASLRPPFLCLPEDILLEIVRSLDVAAVLALLDTCTALHKYTDSRSLWLIVTTALRHLRPLPAPTCADLTRLDACTLRSYARHAHRLDANWARPRPRVFAHTTAVHAGRGHSLLAIIPGTRLVLVHDVARSALECWDTRTSRWCASVSVDGKIFALSSRYEQTGMYAVACTVCRQMWIPTCVNVIRVTYGEQDEEVTMRRVWEQEMLPNPFHEVIFYEDVVGIISSDRGDSFVSLHAVNIVTGQSVVRRFDMALWLDDLFAAIVDGALYITAAQGPRRVLYRLPRSALPYQSNPAPTQTAAPLDTLSTQFASGAVDASDLVLCTFASPFPGVRTIELLLEHDDDGGGAPGMDADMPGVSVGAYLCTAWGPHGPPPRAVREGRAHANQHGPAPENGRENGTQNGAAAARAGTPPPLALSAAPGGGISHVSVPGRIARFDFADPDSSPLASSSSSWIMFCSSTRPDFSEITLHLALPPPVPASTSAEEVEEEEPAGAMRGEDGLVGEVPRRRGVIVCPEVPPEVDMSRVTAIKLDAYLGMLYMFTHEGVLHCVSYA